MGLQIHHSIEKDEVIISSNGVIHYKGTQEAFLKFIISSSYIADCILLDIEHLSENELIDIETYKEFGELYGTPQNFG